MDITGRKLFVKALQEEGVTTLFGYPGSTSLQLCFRAGLRDERCLVSGRNGDGSF